MIVIAASWRDAIADRPVEAALYGIIFAAGITVAAIALRRVTRRARSLRNQVLAVTLAALAIGAVAAAVLARLMILDSGELMSVGSVLAITALLAAITPQAPRAVATASALHRRRV